MNVGCTGTHQETGRPRLGQALAAASRRGPLPSSCACFVAAHRPMNRLKRKRGQDARGWRQPFWACSSSALVCIQLCFPSQALSCRSSAAKQRAAAPAAAVSGRRAHIHDGRGAPTQEKQERARGCGRRGGRRCGCWGRDAGSRRKGRACRRGVRVQAAVPRVPGFAEAGPHVL